MVADTSINHLSADNILYASDLRQKLTDDRITHISYKSRVVKNTILNHCVFKSYEYL